MSLAHPASSATGKLAIISGMGKLPLAVAEEARLKGYYVVGIALQPPADESLKAVADDFHKIRIGSFGGLLSLIRKLSVTDAVLAGKIPKKLLYQDKLSLVPDLKAMKLFLSLKDRSDDTIMNAIVGELEKKGVTIHNTTDFTANILAPAGILTKKRPAKEALADALFGWNIARKIGEADIGQTVIVKNRAVMAVEAIEGTDETIRRGGQLAGNDAVVVKVSKPGQDMRFDVPAVGMETMQSMQASGAGMLVLEAGKCIMIEKDKLIREADKSGIIIACLTDGILK